VIKRLSSGQANLDAVLGGGIPEHSIVLVAGAPGTGKTMLAQQYVFTNGTPESPSLYVTTATEPLEKVVRFGQELDFFDRGAVGRRVIYEGVGDTLAVEGLSGVMDRLVTLLAQIRPGVLVIDSFKALAPYAADQLEYRRFVAELVGRLSAVPVTSLWVGEYDASELMLAAESAVADGIISLSSAEVDQRTTRYLQVMKLRGGSFLSGQHAYRLGSGGLQVFPRLAEVADVTPPADGASRLSLGGDGLDALVEGGVWPGTTTLVIGPSGAGKTMLGLGFLARGAREGRRGVFATLQESPIQMDRQLRAMDGEMDRGRLDQMITFHHGSPVDIYIDEWVHDVFATLERTGSDLLLVDSLSDLRLSVADGKRFDEYVYSFVQRLGRKGITALMTLESRPVFSLSGMVSTSLSNLADNIILLAYQVEETDVRRVVHVLKSRASTHDAAIREFGISAAGISVGEPIPGVGALTA
jgi:circadian clock protein KaiC